jgi:hypothetical protein
MTDADLQTFIHWLQLHTALGRIAYGELEAALEKARDDGGYSFTAPKAAA